MYKIKVSKDIDRTKPVRIQFNTIARGFYCPTCMTGTYNEEHVCEYCGQVLLNCYECFDKDKSK